MHRVFLSLGSNLGDRKESLNRAVDLLSLHAGRIVGLSSIYETEPWGCTACPDFYNMVVELDTSLDPFRLLDVLHEIEFLCGRTTNAERYAPRTMDIDILLVDDLVIASESLLLPHPLIQARRFVLQPLSELAPALIHPLEKKTIRQLLETCTDERRVSAIQEPEKHF
jgi:2-amino-4-hydroxy-6-hydroxymethyldihydropteridine diphosphokinase